MAYDIKTDGVVGGFAVFNGPHKLCVVTTHEHRGLFRNGVGLMEPMPRSSWSIHWVSPSQPVELTEAVLAVIPRE